MFEYFIISKTLYNKIVYFENFVTIDKLWEVSNKVNLKMSKVC